MPADRRKARVASEESPVGRRAPSVDARRVVIENIRPQIDAGRFPIKRTTGESVEVRADVFADGHDLVTAVLLHRHEPGFGIGDSGFGSLQIPNPESPIPWTETPMEPAAPGSDEWRGRFEVDEIGWHEYMVVAWVDRFATWRGDLDLKTAAGQDVSPELREGALMDANVDRSRATHAAPLRVWVDRERARFGAWYEMFPRSTGDDPGRGGTFRDARARLRQIADLGFDVVYLPPIHPIGRSFRKGRNNSLRPAPDDPGSPWAIGSEDGGHTAIEPGLGTFDDFTAFRRDAARLGLELALDLAWQCSPDHPWVREHPGWFRHRPDGTIKYAENPPKRYQDIYPLDFECDDWRALWRELLAVTRFWIDRGVAIFRVDNPHTKTFAFWEWLIAEVHARDPHVLFLSEAFTRPPVMRYLAKAGFTQSYTYFTWRNTKEEITEHFTELTATDVREYLRPNLFVNTPDILHAYLQDGGRPAFEARLLLGATLGANYGIYSGFELCENLAVPGSEEYADSEKYQIRLRDWDRPGHIKELVTRVNQIRRQSRALQSDWTLRFHATDNPQIIAYSKSPPDRSHVILVVVNLDPHRMQHGWVEVPETVRPRGEGPDRAYAVRDLVDDASYTWRGAWNYVRFDPGVRQGHILRLDK